MWTVGSFPGLLIPYKAFPKRNKVVNSFWQENSECWSWANIVLVRFLFQRKQKIKLKPQNIYMEQFINCNTINLYFFISYLFFPGLEEFFLPKIAACFCHFRLLFPKNNNGHIFSHLFLTKLTVFYLSVFSDPPV